VTVATGRDQANSRVQRDYLEGKSDKSARDYFFYFSGATPSAVRYKNWKMYYNMSQPGPAGWIMPLVPFHFTLVQNIKRDPFEQAVGIDQKTAMSIGGALGAPATAFQYDWNMLPIGQQLWMEELSSYEKFPPLQAPESYNLSQILEQVKKANANHAGDQGLEASASVTERAPRRECPLRARRSPRCVLPGQTAARRHAPGGGLRPHAASVPAGSGRPCAPA